MPGDRVLLVGLHRAAVHAGRVQAVVAGGRHVLLHRRRAAAAEEQADRRARPRRRRARSGCGRPVTHALQPVQRSRSTSKAYCWSRPGAIRGSDRGNSGPAAEPPSRRAGARSFPPPFPAAASRADRRGISLPPAGTILARPARGRGGASLRSSGSLSAVAFIECSGSGLGSEAGNFVYGGGVRRDGAGTGDGRAAVAAVRSQGAFSDFFRQAPARKPRRPRP